MSFFTRAPNFLTTDSADTSFGSYFETTGHLVVEDETSATPRRESSARELPHHSNVAAHHIKRERERERE